MVRIEPEDEPEPVSRSEFDAWLQRGVEHFNQGEYMEAHEAFERVWLSAQDSDSDFYKGLIQGSICLHHLQRGNPDGAKKLYGGQRKLLAGFLPVHRGLDLEGFLSSMQSFMRPVLRGGEVSQSCFSEAKRPRLQPRRQSGALD